LGLIGTKWLRADSMSTLSGIVSKGEKGKSKFQSLDINSLYRVSRVSWPTFYYFFLLIFGKLLLFTGVSYHKI